MKRVLNSNTFPVQVTLNGSVVEVLARESVVVEDHVLVEAPNGVFVVPQNSFIDNRAETRNVLLG